MKKPLLTLAFALAAALPAPVASAAASDWSTFGTLKNETASFVSGDERLDKSQNRLDLSVEGYLSDAWEFHGRLLTWYDAAADWVGDRPGWTGPIRDHYRTFGETKEAFSLYGGDSFDLRLGQQQIVWGKMDGLRLIDILNPLDMREFLLDDFLDSRIGLVSARLNYYLGDHELELIAIPDARTNRLAPMGSRWGFAMPSVPAGVTVNLLGEALPKRDGRDTELAAAWRSNIGGWDLSLNLFHGFKAAPSLRKQLSAGVMTLQAVHIPLDVVGGSFANALGDWVVRGEVAVNLGEGINTSDVAWDRSVARKTTLNGAVALETTRNNWTVSGQLFGRRIQNYEARLQEAQSSGFATLRVATDYLNERLKPEVMVLVDLADHGWMARPKASFEISDAWLVNGGADLFGGDRGFFGQFADNDRIYAELQYSF